MSELFWQYKQEVDRRRCDVDEKFFKEYDNLFPDIYHGDSGLDPTFLKWQSFEDMMASDGVTSEFADDVIEKYMEYWNDEEDIPNLEMLKEVISERYEDLVFEIMDRDYSKDEQYQNDDEYKASVEEMYMDSFWNGPGLLISMKIAHVLDAFNYSYVAEDQVTIERKDGIKSSVYIKERLYNPAQRQFFHFKFSNIVEM